jgi:hypothetical protein
MSMRYFGACRFNRAGLDFAGFNLQIPSGSSKNGWGDPLGFLNLFSPSAGLPIVSWAHRGRLDVLTGPWISCENVRHE